MFRISEKQIHLDPQKFDSGTETRAIAEIVSKHAERCRAEQRRIEVPSINWASKSERGSSVIRNFKIPDWFGVADESEPVEVFASDQVPWYIWLEKIEAIEPCSKECGMSVAKLAKFIVNRFEPENKQAYLWMADAQHKLIDRSTIKELLAENSTNSSEGVARIDGVKLKRAALIKKYKASWRTIESDLNHYDDNGLGLAAKAPERGYWYELASLDWADARGKRSQNPLKEAVSSVFDIKGTVHTQN